MRSRRGRDGWAHLGEMASFIGLVLVVAGACAPMGTGGPGASLGPSPEDALLAGARALEMDHFAAAERHLAPLTGRCLDSPTARQAALLRASAALDPANRAGAPDAAARWAASVLASAPPDDPARAHARSLFRLALDQGGSVPESAHPAGCDVGDDASVELPAMPVMPTAERLQALSDSLRTRADAMAAQAEALSARADSLTAARQRALDAERHTQALEAELERIRRLLRGGAEPRS